MKPGTPLLIYVAAPYRASTRWEEEQNVRRAEDLGRQVVELGAYPVIPHSNTRPYFGDLKPAAFWLGGTLELMRRCDAVLFADGWENSEGCQLEHAEATFLGRPIFTESMMTDLDCWIYSKERQA